MHDSKSDVQALSIVDIGANLTNRAFERDCDYVIRRARDAGVRKIIVTGSSIESSVKAASLAARMPGLLYSTAGVHPHDAKSAGSSTVDEIRSIAKSENVVAIGECGLDFNRNYSEPKTQEKWFSAQVELACEMKKPLFLHERDALKRFREILSAFKSSLPKVVVHCFTGSHDELFRYLDLGFYIGITGWICDERRGRGLKDLAKEIPLDRLMIETDAPYLIPRTIRSKPKDSRNEPAFLTYVLAEIALSTGRSMKEIASATYENSAGFFGIGTTDNADVASDANA